MNAIIFVSGEQPHVYEPGDDFVARVRFDSLQRTEAVQLLATGVASGRRPDSERLGTKLATLYS